MAMWMKRALGLALSVTLVMGFAPFALMGGVVGTAHAEDQIEAVTAPLIAPAAAEGASDEDAGLTAQSATDATVSLFGVAGYKQAREVLAIVNKERAAAGVASLTLDYELTKTAMLRAAEVSLHYAHTRPNGQECFTAIDNMKDGIGYGENIAMGYTNPTNVMKAWFTDEKQVHEWQKKGITLEQAIKNNYKLPSGEAVSSSNWQTGHYENIIKPEYKSIGIGYFAQSERSRAWEQMFSSAVASDTSKVPNDDRNETFTFNVDFDQCGKNFKFYDADGRTLSGSLGLNTSTTAIFCMQNTGFPSWYARLTPGSVSWKSSNSGICALGLTDDKKTEKVTGKAKGTATITATLGSGSRAKSISHAFTVAETVGTMAPNSVGPYTYTGSPIEPNPTIKNASGATLKKGTDYTITYKYNTRVGRAQMTIAGKGAYTGSKTIYFTIQPAPITSVTLSKTSYSYDGKEKKPTVTVKSNSKTLVLNKDYKLTYPADTKSVGNHTVTVEGFDNYAGTQTATYAIVGPNGSSSGGGSGSNGGSSGNGSASGSGSAGGSGGSSSSSAKGEPMYRLYNPNSGEHFYTASAYERDSVKAAGWKYEGVGWTAPTSGDPVYRLYNKNGGEHHYTPSKVERDSLVKAGWKYEGIGWRSGGSTPLYRQYNPNQFANNHNYTTSSVERNHLIKIGWKNEGIAWYGLK